MNHCSFEVDIAGTRCPNTWEKKRNGALKEESCARDGYTKSMVGISIVGNTHAMSEM